MKRINFETAKLAKEKGFDEKVHVGYTSHELLTIRHTPPLSFNDNCEYRTYYSAPTQPFLQKWLREEHGIAVDVISYIQQDEDKNQKFSFIYSILKLHATEGKTSKRYNIYEEALEQGLQKGLDLIND